MINGTKLSFTQIDGTQELDTPETHQTDAVQTGGANQQIDAMFAASDDMARRVLNPELMALRHQNPFLSIMPFPMKCLFVVAAKNNDTRDVQLPDGTQLVRFSAMRTIEYFVSVNGQVQLPPPENLEGNAPMYCPNGQWYYVKGLRSLSIGLPVANSGICIEVYIQL